MQKQKIEVWKQKIRKQYATKQRTKPEKVQVLPWNTKQRIAIADKVIAEAICLINQRLYDRMDKKVYSITGIHWVYIRYAFVRLEYVD